VEGDAGGWEDGFHAAWGGGAVDGAAEGVEQAAGTEGGQLEIQHEGEGAAGEGGGGEEVAFQGARAPCRW
jgi:hypothetical protein